MAFPAMEFGTAHLYANSLLESGQMLESQGDRKSRL